MHDFLQYTVAGIATYGCVYALTAMGLVVTYTTSGIFNFAQGAIGMIAAFIYWQFTQGYHWPSWLGLILVVLIIAPLLGAGIERLIVRRLENASLEAKLTVTVALLLFGIGLATAIWNPGVSRSIPEFFNGKQVSIGGVVLTWHQLIVVGLAAGSAGALRIFFYRTRAGIALRAVVDDRELTALTGASPARYTQMGWALGCSLAALAGILIAPLINLDITTLTLIGVSGYAAAVVGRLRSLPLTFLGAIILGLLETYGTGYLPSGTTWSALENVIPMLFLLICILVLPQSRTSLSRRIRIRAPRVVGRNESFLGGGLLIALAVVAGLGLSTNNLTYATRGVAVGIVMLSLVLLTGYGGQVSLCQMSFAGLGAYAMSKVGGTHGSLLGILAAIGLAGAVGTIVALPSLRLRGLYLALATLAFAFGMDTVFFENIRFFGATDALSVARPHIPGISTANSGTYLIVLGVVFAALTVALLAVRRSRFGRRLLAITDSPGACLTLGVGMNWSKLAVFTISAGIAGLGGALYGGAQGTVTNNDFPFLLSLTLLLLAVVWGIRTTTGMLVGGIIFALQPLIQQHLTTPRDAFTMLVGLAAIGVSQNPEGTFGGNTPLQKWRERRQSAGMGATDEAALAGLSPTVDEGLSHVAG